MLLPCRFEFLEVGCGWEIGSKAGGDVGAFASSYSSSYNGEFGTS
jgi:hypothetical protein